MFVRVCRIGVGKSFARPLNARVFVGLPNVEFRYEQGLSVPKTSSGVAGLWAERNTSRVVGVYGELRAVAGCGVIARHVAGVPGFVNLA